MTTAHTIRKFVIAVTAVSVFSLPLISAAATASSDQASRSLLNSEWQPEIQNDADAVYGKLKAESKEVCGSAERRVTGSLRRSQEVEQCYHETLTAAVQRLDDSEVTELHYQ